MSAVLKRIQAFFHWSNAAVCEMSKGRGPHDFHDYRDCLCKTPMHMHLHECVRCRKQFYI